MVRTKIWGNMILADNEYKAIRYQPGDKQKRIVRVPKGDAALNKRFTQRDDYELVPGRPQQFKSGVGVGRRRAYVGYRYVGGGATPIRHRPVTGPPPSHGRRRSIGARFQHPPPPPPPSLPPVRDTVIESGHFVQPTIQETELVDVEPAREGMVEIHDEDVPRVVRRRRPRAPFAVRPAGMRRVRGKHERLGPGRLKTRYHKVHRSQITPTVKRELALFIPLSAIKILFKQAGNLRISGAAVKTPLLHAPSSPYELFRFVVFIHLSEVLKHMPPTSMLTPRALERVLAKHMVSDVWPSKLLDVDITKLCRDYYKTTVRSRVYTHPRMHRGIDISEERLRKRHRAIMAKRDCLTFTSRAALKRLVKAIRPRARVSRIGIEYLRNYINVWAQWFAFLVAEIVRSKRKKTVTSSDIYLANLVLEDFAPNLTT